jgi:hypothetical protein
MVDCTKTCHWRKTFCKNSPFFRVSMAARVLRSMTRRAALEERENKWEGLQEVNQEHYHRRLIGNRLFLRAYLRGHDFQLTPGADGITRR